MKVAATYVRASTEMQVYSTLNQTRALEDYALRHDLVILHAYKDEGRSGLDLEGRPGLLRLLQDVLQARPDFQVLLVYDVSRWGRFQDIDESAHYEYLCRRAGVELVYVAEPFTNDGTAIAHLLKAVKRTMAAEYSRELSEKVRHALRNMANLGYTLSAAPYGLRRLLLDPNGKVKGVLEHGERKSIHTDRVILTPGPPDEIRVVRRIFHRYVYRGLGFKEIASDLNEKGHRTAGGKLWDHARVRQILEREQYIGTTVYGQTSVHLGKRCNEPKAAWIRVEGTHEPIVPKRTFLRAQKRMESGRWARTDAHFLLPLKALYEREGFLSPALINAEPGMPCSRAYAWRFRRITNAYRQVGYTSPYEEWGRWSRARTAEPDRDGLLAKLKELLDREGYLSEPLIRKTTSMPSFRAYQWAFGSLANAYALIGYKPAPTRALKGRRSRESQEQADQKRRLISLRSL